MGLSEAENEALLEELFTYLYDPKAVLEHDWRQGDLAIWDNIGTQHGRGSVALAGPERTLRKVTGPISLDADEMIMPTFPKLAGAMM
jgi:alpha-ketoglutarate-dependent taurine dioxygenase